MKLTLRVKRMLPSIFEAMDKGEDPKEIRICFTLTPQLYKIVKDQWEETRGLKGEDER
jgi:hypothetical protein